MHVAHVADLVISRFPSVAEAILAILSPKVLGGRPQASVMPNPSSENAPSQRRSLQITEVLQ